MKKKTIIGIAVAVAIAAGAYFGIAHIDRMPTLAEGFGILESEIEIRGVYPGWSGELPLTIINGKDQDRVFSVTLEQANPAKLKFGYEALPAVYYDWFEITGWNGKTDILEPEVTLAAGKHHTLMIVVAVPNDMAYLGKNAEVRVRVSDMTSPGLVALAIESRWYIITAQESS